MTTISDLVAAAAAEIDFEDFLKRNRHLTCTERAEQYKDEVTSNLLKRAGARSLAELHARGELGNSETAIGANE
jgi:hypothetical protein